MDYANEFPVKKMCDVLEVSRSGYYKWLLNKDSLDKEKQILDNEIEKVFDKSRKTYGSPRIHTALCKMDIKVSKRTVARRMKELKISPVVKKIKNTTDSKHGIKISPNLLDREFSVSESGRFWVGDITYIRLKDSFVYLTTVIDLADRMVIGWNLSDNMTDRDTTVVAFNKAVKNRPVLPRLVFHSDRGSQYASKDFRKLFTTEQCIQSMSRKGNC
jgi:putative transposase